MNFQPERLVSVRQRLGINKAEAARLLNMSAMGYGRYEKGERVPSFQTISFIAQTFHTTVEFLCGETDIPKTDRIVVSSRETPELYQLVESLQKREASTAKRLLAYLNKIDSEA